MIKKMIIKYSNSSIKEISRELEYEINQIISKSISAEEPIDILYLLNKEKPDISIIDEKLLSQLKNLPQKNYAIDSIIKLLNDEIKAKMKKNPFRYKSLHELLEKSIEEYNKNLINNLEIIEQLEEIAKDFKKKYYEGKQLDLTDEELIFYDLLSRKKELFKNEELIKRAAKEIVKNFTNFTKTADWYIKESSKANIRKSIKETLIKFVNEKVEYEDINKITSEIYEQTKEIYAA